jgi:hypothetical protein
VVVDQTARLHRRVGRRGWEGAQVIGFLVLAASGFVLAMTASKESAAWLIPGLVAGRPA